MSYEQQGQSQPQQPSYVNAAQQWQQQPYVQQFNQGYAQNNTQNPIRKKSRAPLIIGIVAAILIIAGLAVTGIILLNSSTPSTPEETVERFMDAILDGDYEKALDDYIHPLYVANVGGKEDAIENIERMIDNDSTYRYKSSEKNANDYIEANEYLKEYGYDKATEVCRIYIDIGENGGKMEEALFAVVKINGKWYILNFKY